MWANALGLGGILPIQVRRVLDDTGFLLTGTQGDTMKESIPGDRTRASILIAQKYLKEIVVNTVKNGFWHDGYHIFQLY